MVVLLNFWAKIIPSPLLLCDQRAELNVIIQIPAHVIVSVAVVYERFQKTRGNRCPQVSDTADSLPSGNNMRKSSAAKIQIHIEKEPR